MTKSMTWIQKLKNSPDSVLKETDKGLMYISNPREIKKFIEKNVSKGSLATTKIIAEKLAAKNSADFTCPLTTGIFLSIVANAAEQERSEGKKRITPYWRIVKHKGRLYNSYLGQINPQKEMLEAEGFRIKKGKAKWSLEVENFGKYLIK